MKQVQNVDGVREEWDLQGKELRVTHTEDITQLIEDNKRRFNETSSWRKFDPKKEFHQILDLSMTDVMRIYTDHGIDVTGPQVDWKYVKKIIQRDYPYMKCVNARL